MTAPSIEQPSRTEYAPSSPAVHAARAIRNNFTVCERGRVEATEHNIAALVDYATQMYRMAPALDRLVKSAQWLDRDELRAGMDRLRQAVQAVETIRVRQPKFEDGKALAQSEQGERPFGFSAAALHAARLLMQQFTFSRKASLAATEKNLAILVDVCTDAFRVEAVVSKIASNRLWQSPDELKRNIEELREALRAAELVRNHMPRRKTSQRVVVHESRGEVEIPLTREQKADVERFAQLVITARTVQDQQHLLQKAGFVRHVTR